MNAYPVYHYRGWTVTWIPKQNCYLATRGIAELLAGTLAHLTYAINVTVRHGR
jgi:hypothetical protein